MLDNENPPKHQFPCEYVIKVIGLPHQAFPNEIIDIVKTKTTLKTHKITPSKNNNFISLSITMFLENEESLKEIYLLIKDKPYIKMIL